MAELRIVILSCLLMVVIFESTLAQQHYTSRGNANDPYQDFVDFVSSKGPGYREYSSTNQKETKPVQHEYERSGGHTYGGQRGQNSAFAGGYDNRGGYSHGDPNPNQGGYGGGPQGSASYDVQASDNYGGSGYASQPFIGSPTDGLGHASYGGY